MGMSNLSEPISDTIRLDSAAGTERTLSVNADAVWTNSTAVTLTIGALAGTTQMQLSNGGGFTGAVWQAFDTRPAWQLSEYDDKTAATRLVYVKTRDAAGTVSVFYLDDIILDPVAPTGSVTISNVSSTTVQVQLAANDPRNLSGVTSMRVGLADELAQAPWEPYATSSTIDRSGTGNVEVCAQFRDGAGNVSTPTCASSATEFLVYLPLVRRP